MAVQIVMGQASFPARNLDSLTLFWVEEILGSMRHLFLGPENGLGWFNLLV